MICSTSHTHGFNVVEIVGADVPSIAVEVAVVSTSGVSTSGVSTSSVEERLALCVCAVSKQRLRSYAHTHDHTEPRCFIRNSYAHTTYL